MAANEAHTLSLIRRDFKLMKEFCRRFAGQVVKSTGDGLLMYFISAVQAVACAQAIQEALASAADQLPPSEVLDHRIGIHLGEVFLSPRDVMGSGVNIAARLQAEAAPRGICLSQFVYDVVKSHLTLEAVCLGVRPLKNVPESICIYHILPPAIANPPPASLSPPPAMARLQVEGPGASCQEYCLDQDILTIGRAPDNDVILTQAFVSRYHAQIIRQGDRHWITDLGSRDGTRLNGTPLLPQVAQPLQDQDRIAIGMAEMRFCAAAPAGLAAAKLLIHGSDGTIQEYRIEQAVTTLGRAADNHLILSESFVSRHHAQLKRSLDQFTLTDLGSTSGTCVNQTRLQPHIPQPLHPGDVIHLGPIQVSLTLADPPTPALPPTLVIPQGVKVEPG